MKFPETIAVTSRAFSNNPVLRAELSARYAGVKFNETGRQLGREEVIEFLRGHAKAIVSLEVIDEPVLSALPDLRVISKYGVGLDNLDFTALERRGIRVGWRGGVNKRSVSELALTFMISNLRRVTEGNLAIRSGKWQPLVGGLLSDKTVGIIGCGHIGKDLITLLQPFGCRILPHDIRSFPEFYARFGLEPVSLEKALRESDIVTLHIPNDESTRLLLNRERLSWMKPGAILINTARGNLVDENAVKEALISKRLAAAAFDVFGVEPPTDPELLGLPNFLATPHIGGSAQEAIIAMGRSAIDGLENPRVVHEVLAELNPPI